MANPIQQHLGQRVVEAVREFILNELETKDEFETKNFSHIDDAKTRSALAQTMFGARWLCKTGLVLLAANEERSAHIRAQIIDYASICECVLGDMIIHGQTRGSLQGTTKDFEDYYKKRAINWAAIANIRNKVEAAQFWWRIEVAAESGMLTPKTAQAIRVLKKARNTVHIHRGLGHGAKYFLNDAVFAFEHTLAVLKQTAAWKAENS